MNQILITIIGDHPTIQYAAAELQRYLAKATGQPVAFAESTNLPQESLQIGLISQFADLQLPTSHPLFDDAIAITTNGASGTITGNNPRSVLLAVYRYLHLLGLHWVRPGADGEYIPIIDLATTSIQLHETPSYRHRGICIEGAVSLEHVCDLIDWMPKVGLNAYFMQFREGFTFFDRWYSHFGHPTKQQSNLTVEEARQLVRQVITEAKKRDLLYHAVGHGWTCEPFGIPGLGWEYPPEPVPAEAIQYLALVNGRRELWQGIPLNTSLCFSNPVVRELVTDSVIEYAEKNPEIDLIHFWLDDGTNNHCECPNCAETRPSDYYVMMLNQIDQKLTQKQLAVRIVFLAYFDLLWPPEHERIQNNDRFVLMFAPITRTYSKTFSTEQELPAIPPYLRNKLTFPERVDQNLAFLHSWQAQLNKAGQPVIDSFDFDYHLMWDHYRDPAYIQITETLHGDLQLLQQLELDGFISCQVQRAFFPTGLPMHVLGATLWDRKSDLQALTSDYFAAAFGPNSAKAYAYLKQLSALFDPVYLRREKPEAAQPAVIALAQIPALIAAFLPTIQQNCTLPQPCWAHSWRYLELHATFATGLANALHAQASGDQTRATAEWSALKEWLWQHEEELHPVFDIYLATRVYDRLIFDF